MSSILSRQWNIKYNGIEHEFKLFSNGENLKYQIRDLTDNISNEAIIDLPNTSDEIKKMNIHHALNHHLPVLDEKSYSFIQPSHKWTLENNRELSLLFYGGKLIWLLFDKTLGSGNQISGEHTYLSGEAQPIGTGSIVYGEKKYQIKDINASIAFYKNCVIEKLNIKNDELHSVVVKPYPDLSFPGLLTPEKAFYNHPNYLENTQKDFSKTTTVPVTYTWNTQHIAFRIVKLVLSIIIFPISLYKFFHVLAAKIALLISSQSKYIKPAHENRNRISLSDVWKYKRITIQVDGCNVDAMIVGKADTLNNGRWVLTSGGNSELYENVLCQSTELNQMLNDIKGNALVFNYPGVGASSGLPTRSGMEKAYRAMLAFLEDKNKGIGAKEIVMYGYSMGGGTQSMGLKKHNLKEDIKYVVVKNKSYWSLEETASYLAGKILGLLLKILGWDINCAKISKKLNIPEIILQTAQVNDYEILTDSSKIIDDGVIHRNASLAKKLLDSKSFPHKNKLILGVKENHFEPFLDTTFLSRHIENFLKA
jgi:hypothetical protein